MSIDPNKIDRLCQEVVALQQKKLLQIARRILPFVTPEDILQPNDFPELENHPVFRYEEGVLHGMQSMQMSLRAMIQDHQKDASK